MESYFVIQKNRICFRKICPRLVSVSYLSKKNINTGHLRVWPEVVNENKRNLNKLSLFISGALKNEKKDIFKGLKPMTAKATRMWQNKGNERAIARLKHFDT